MLVPGQVVGGVLGLAQRALPAVVQGVLVRRQPVLVLDVWVPVGGKNLHRRTTRTRKPACKRNISEQTKHVIIRRGKLKPRLDDSGLPLQAARTAVVFEDRLRKRSALAWADACQAAAAPAKE